MHRFTYGAVALATSVLACSSTSGSGTAGGNDGGLGGSPGSSSSAASSGTTSSSAGGGGGDAGHAVGLAKLNHIVVIVLENWSFDSLYAEFQGAEGLTNALQAPKQIDPATGQPYATLPETESHIPMGLPNTPFALDPYLGAGQDTSIDLTQKFYQEQQQIHGGMMDKFVSVSSAKGLTMGYFHTADLPLATEAKNYVLLDHFFHGVFGGSFQNHVFLVSAAVATFPNAPASMVAVLDASGNPVVNPTTMVLQDGPVTPDGYVVGTVYSVNSPHPATTPAAQLLPSQTMPTIGDELSAANVDWAWYSGGWNQALAGTDAGAANLFQYHHQPFVYFANYADGTPGRAAHLKDETDFMTAAQAGTLPAVSFVKPDGVDNEHPNYTDVLTGEVHTEQLINAVRNGPNWADTAIIITYDENGGFWDHVAPPPGDKWGPGSRVPTIIVSPFAKKGYVDKTVYETVSITALIEHRFGLAALGTRDAAAADLSNAFDFAQ